MATQPEDLASTPLPLSDEKAELLGTMGLAQVEFQPITAPGPWLHAAYDLLAAEFGPEVLDPHYRYVDWMELTGRNEHPFPFLMMAAVFRRQGQAYLLGVIAGNLMPIRPYVDSPDPPADRTHLLAIGHQVTSPLLRKHRVHGVGLGLWKAFVAWARRQSEGLGCACRFSFLEAEAESVGFWTKVGYRWPQGVYYWQPPLEFDEQGHFLHPEVPEIPLLLSFDEPEAPFVDRHLLQNMIATVYLNWSLFKYNNTLAPESFRRAEQYVMGELFARVCHKMPREKQLKLIKIRLAEDAGASRRYRTVALGTGLQHGLQPLQAPHLNDFSDFDELLLRMKDMAFGARTLGEAGDVLHAMVTDPTAKVIMTVAGAASIAKLDAIIADMIERDLVHCLVTTGAFICHAFNAERGCIHYKNPEGATDLWLYEQGYDRIYDTIETEYALDELEGILQQLLEKVDPSVRLCSADITALLGEYLETEHRGTGVIRAAYRKKIPIFVPAFTDSELGLDFALFNHYRRQAAQPAVSFDPFIDFERFSTFVRTAQTRGIITLGGGVPRNWTQQIGPFVDAMERRENAISVNSVRFKYAVRICPEPVQWGGLSGSSYSEGISWGKFLAPDEGGRHAEVPSDYSLVFPLLIKGLFQRLDKHQGRGPDPAGSGRPFVAG
jgi:deoxyhypusine synthase